MEDAVKDRLNDCRATVLVSDDELLQRVPQEKIPSLQTILRVGDIEGRGFDGPPGSPLVERVDLDAGLIIHYTSGSTGQPTALLWPHRRVVHHYVTGEWLLGVMAE